MDSRGLSLVGAVLAALLFASGCPKPTGPASVSPGLRASLNEWHRLCELDGCFCGSQDWSAKGPTEGSSLRAGPWRAFLDETPPELVLLLVDRFDSTRMTAMHVCPFARATEGELALYTVQHLLKVNWYDYDDRRTHCAPISVGIAALRSDRPNRGGRQAIVRVLLANDEAREELKRFFLQKLDEWRAEQTASGREP